MGFRIKQMFLPMILCTVLVNCTSSPSPQVVPTLAVLPETSPTTSDIQGEVDRLFTQTAQIEQTIAPTLTVAAAFNNALASTRQAELDLTVTYMPEFATLQAILSPMPNLNSLATPGFVPFQMQDLPTDLQKRGTVSSGETVNGTVDTFTDDSWTFNGEAGQTVVIELNAVDNAFDPQLTLYDPNGAWIAENDDLDGSSNRNSRIEMTLPSTGRYTIRVGAFGDGGDYTLTLN